MATPPLQQRYPFDLEGKVHPDVEAAIRYSFSGLLDLNQALRVTSANIKTLQTTAAKSTTVTPASPSSTTVVTAGVTSFNALTGAVLFFAPLGTVSNQSGETAYTTEGTDAGALIVLSDASAIAVTLSDTVMAPWFAVIMNMGAGTATLTPASGTISYAQNPSAGSMTLAVSAMAIVYFDATNFWAVTAGNSGYTPIGGTTGSRPSSPPNYTVYFDTTIGFPVWWTGSSWVNAAGMVS